MMNQTPNESERLLEVFLEEARDILDLMSGLTDQWSSDLNNKQFLIALKRELHTLKGGARMMGQKELSTLAHDAESLCQTFLASDHVIQESDHDLICASQDRMNTIVEFLKNKKTVPAMEEVQTSNDSMRVSADLLEKLNDLSIENNIMRVNLNHQVDHLNTQVAEMVRLTKLLQEKVRLLPEGTDPSITTETMSLLDLGKNLSQLHLQLESLLSKQSRVDLELQHKLVDTRMISFKSVLPRLGRIARQLAAELHKDVALEVFEAEGEMDRNLLENLIPSLEHLLRNAIDHGIETPAIRTQLHKESVGKIGLRFFRRGTEACIEVSDDGAGLDVEAIRRKATQLALISEQKPLSEDTIIRFILEPGFSTREVVSQISGRGLGLDIANTVVKGLGGNISIETKKDKGTTFIIRIPFTSSMNRALLVKVQTQTYGILLSNIERVVLLNSKQMMEKLKEASPLVYFENKEYNLKYLGEVLGMRHKPSMAKPIDNFPVLLFHFSDDRVALLVDALSGSQEVAVQSLGPQLKLIDMFGGATLLPDGRPIIILDVYAITSQGSVKLISKPDPKLVEKKKQHVLVVDDSITVRTVTKHFLERYHYQVDTAKDGVEALEKIALKKPDILLLDLEMPRANGFEVAERLRSQTAYADLPIIMITFCAEEERIERAKALGIDRFVRKPYKESELLMMIENLLEKKVDKS